EVNNTNVFFDSLIINIPPAPFKGGDVTVSIHEKHFWSVSYFTKLYHTATTIWLCGKSVGTLRRRSNRNVTEK
ncbi:hypothetical protein, partial [Capnocytophaga leadbetteri]